MRESELDLGMTLMEETMVVAGLISDAEPEVEELLGLSPSDSIARGRPASRAPADEDAEADDEDIGGRSS